MIYENLGISFSDALVATEYGHSPYDDSDALVVVSEADFLLERDLRIQAEDLARKDSKFDFVLNDRGMQEAFDEIQSNRNEGDVVVLLYLDINHFKSTNDAIGHIQADDVLAQYAYFLFRNIREGDAIARHGGDEFAIIANCAGVDLEDIKKFLKRIQKPYEATYKHGYQYGQREIASSVGMTIVLPKQDYGDAMEEANTAARWIKDSHNREGLALKLPHQPPGLLDPGTLESFQRRSELDSN